MDTYLISLLLSFVASVSLTPLVIRGAYRMNLVDSAGASHRKVHAEDIPRLGGIAIVVAFYVPIIALSFYNTRVGDRLLGDDALFMGLLGGGLAIAKSQDEQRSIHKVEVAFSSLLARHRPAQR